MAGVAPAFADDWPQWLGPNRDGVWRETGIVERLPKQPAVRWRAPLGEGYSGPTVAQGKVYVLDRLPKKDSKGSIVRTQDKGLAGVERTVCLDGSSGKVVWEHAVDRPYRMSYPEGPRAAPLVAQGRVYSLGAMGNLFCLDATTGKPIWERDFVRDYKAPIPVWGWSSHPLLDGDKVITLVGGPGSAVVAFHKDTGKELWRSLSSEEVGYAPPAIYTLGGRRQLVVYLSDVLTGLDPETGKPIWRTPYPTWGNPSRPSTPIGMPRQDGDRIFVTSFYEGSLMVGVERDAAAPKVIWQGSNINRTLIPNGLHGLITTPVLMDGHVYGVCAYGELRCLTADAGKRVWETYAATGGKKALFGTAFLVRHEDRFFIFNDAGDLIQARLSPKGYEELGRFHLLQPTQSARGNRKVVWSHPAFANKCIFARNQEEIVCASLAAPAKS
jgi:outer membrane protein assembly factor BamB